VTSKVKGQRNVSSVWYLFANNSTIKSRRNTKITRSVADILQQFQGQKVKGQGHQAALTPWTKTTHILVYGWNTMTRTHRRHARWPQRSPRTHNGTRRPASLHDVRNDLQAESSGWLAVQVTTCRGRRHTVTAALQAAQLVTLRASCGAVYYNRSCLFVCGWVCLFVWCVIGCVTTITRNCMLRSSPNWVCR